MNILDKINSIFENENIFLNYLPDSPDDMAAIFDYSSEAPIQSFGKTDDIYNIQLRVRSLSPSEAHEKAQALDTILNRYNDTEISVIRTTAIMDIGKDSHNPQRQEFTANYKVIHNS